MVRSAEIHLDQILARYAQHPTRYDLKKEITIEQTYWIEVCLPVTNETEDAITNFLFELGAQGYYNQDDIVRAYFCNSDWSEKKRHQFQSYLRQLTELGFPAQADNMQVQKIDNQDWNAQWKQTIKPITIAGKILIKPSWIHVESGAAEVTIEIDPQMAFGTGVHATTQLMLKLLIDHIGSAVRILDMGTGTGILAIAAARLSNARIIAFDNDPVATDTARQNCLKNSVLEKVDIFCGTIDAVKDTRFDLIMANINRSIIFESLSKIFRCLSETGLAIFSGILIDEKKQFIDKIKKYDFEILKAVRQKEWVGMVVSDR